jgi:hypothetical protein
MVYSLQIIWLVIMYSTAEDGLKGYVQIMNYCNATDDHQRKIMISQQDRPPGLVCIQASVKCAKAYYSIIRQSRRLSGG